MLYDLNRQDFYDGDKVITVTATIKKGEVEVKKPFSFLIRRSEMTDNQKLEEDLAYLNGHMSMTVTEDIPFMSESPLPNGSTVTWTSTKEQYVSITGKVTRPEFGFLNETSTVVATLTNGAAQGTFTIDVTVLAITAEDELTMAAGKVTWELIKGGNLSQNRITDNLDLVADIDGIRVTWQSSEPANLAPDGVIVRPENEESDLRVTLTATLTKDGQSRTITLDGLVILKKFATPQQVCETYVANVDLINNFVTNNGANSNEGLHKIFEDFVLPAEETASLMELEWSLVNQSGQPALSNNYISIEYNDGTVQGAKEFVFTVNPSEMTNDISTFLKIKSTIYDDNTVTGEAEMIHSITVSPSQRAMLELSGVPSLTIEDQVLDSEDLEGSEE